MKILFIDLVTMKISLVVPFLALFAFTLITEVSCASTPNPFLSYDNVLALDTEMNGGAHGGCEWIWPFNAVDVSEEAYDEYMLYHDSAVQSGVFNLTDSKVFVPEFINTCVTYEDHIGYYDDHTEKRLGKGAAYMVSFEDECEDFNTASINVPWCFSEACSEEEVKDFFFDPENFYNMCTIVDFNFERVYPPGVAMTTTTLLRRKKVTSIE